MVGKNQQKLLASKVTIVDFVQKNMFQAYKFILINLYTIFINSLPSCLRYPENKILNQRFLANPCSLISYCICIVVILRENPCQNNPSLL